MKTTLEIPDDLMRRVKTRAAQRGQKLKDAVAQLLEAGIVSETATGFGGSLPEPVRLKRVGALTIDKIEAAISAGRTSPAGTGQSAARAGPARGR